MKRVFLNTHTTYLSCINFNFSFTLAFTLSQVRFMWPHWKAPCLNKHSAKQPKRNSTRTEVYSVIWSECTDRCLHIICTDGFLSEDSCRRTRGIDVGWGIFLQSQHIPRGGTRGLLLTARSAVPVRGWDGHTRLVTCLPSLSSAPLYHPI